MAVDALAIKQRTDLLDLIGSDTRLRKAAGTRGGEFAGPCPFCGGHDRLRVQPEKGLWFCRQGCTDGRWQDAIAYVQRRDGCDFVQACQILGASASELGQRSTVNHVRWSTPLASSPPIADDQEPLPAWRSRGAELVETCEETLWSETGARARAYLQDERGLNEETIRNWRLGFQPRDNWFETASSWGLEGQPIWIPRGILIPWLIGGQLWQLKVRTNATDSKKRYKQVRGGHPLLYGADTLDSQRIAVLTEGEFDTLLVHQQAGDLVGVATLGSASKGLTIGAVDYLLGLEHLLLAYDIDEEGERGAQRLADLSPRMRRICPPDGKDATQLWQMGGNIRAWIEFELDQVDPQPSAQETSGSGSSPGPDWKPWLDPVEAAKRVWYPGTCRWCGRPMHDQDYVCWRPERQDTAAGAVG